MQFVKEASESVPSAALIETAAVCLDAPPRPGEECRALNGICMRVRFSRLLLRRPTAMRPPPHKQAAVRRQPEPNESMEEERDCGGPAAGHVRAFRA